MLSVRLRFASSNFHFGGFKLVSKLIYLQCVVKTEKLYTIFAYQSSMVTGEVILPKHNHIMQYSYRDNKRDMLTSVVKVVDF